MAKNDYMVIVYRIMAYIYACQKQGIAFDPDVISYEKLNIPESYYNDIVKDIVDRGYIKGVIIVPILNNEVGIKWNNPKITMEGSQFLDDNSAIEKVKDFLKDLKEIIPGL